MTKAECMKRFGIKPQTPVNIGEKCATKFTDYRNFNHPYSSNKKLFDLSKLNFFIQLTRFEYGDDGYGCYGYVTDEMPFDNLMEIHTELLKDWERPGRRPWNSMHIIGVDEKGLTFSY